jgi:O-antigen/teichoic acid export membrane protein
VVFIILGIINYGNREISAIKNNRKVLTETFWNIYIIQLVMGVGLLFLYLIYVFCFCQEYQVVALIQSLYVASGLLDISWFYFGCEQFRITAGISGLNKLITTVFIFFFVKDTNDLNIYILILSFGALLNNVVYFALLRNYVGKPIFKLEKLKSHLKPILVLFLPVIAINIYRYISKIMLGVMSDISDVGIYDAAERFVNLPLSIIAAIGTVMLARVSSLVAQRDKKSVDKYNRISMACVMMVGFGVAFGLGGI